MSSDTVTDEAIASVTISVLTVLEEKDREHPLQGAGSLQLQPKSHAIILEGSIVMDKIRDLTQITSDSFNQSCSEWETKNWHHRCLV